jgi:putative membrane protein
MNATDIIFNSLLNGLPFLISHFFVSILLLFIGTIIYIFITPMKEMKLIREGNTAASISFSGAIIGIAMPLASSLKASSSMTEIIIWGIVAIIIQLICFKIVDFLISDLPVRIEKGEMSSSILLFTIKISVATINSAAIAG